MQDNNSLQQSLLTTEDPASDGESVKALETKPNPSFAALAVFSSPSSSSSSLGALAITCSGPEEDEGCLDQKRREPSQERDIESGEQKAKFQGLPVITKEYKKAHPLEVAFREGKLVTPEHWTYEVTAFLHYHLVGGTATENLPYPEKSRPLLEMGDNQGRLYRQRYDAVYKPLFDCCDKERHAIGAFYQTYVVQKSIAKLNVGIEWYLDGAWSHYTFSLMESKGYGCVWPFGLVLEVLHQAIKRICGHLTLQWLSIGLTPKKLRKVKEGKWLYDDTKNMWFGGSISAVVFGVWIRIASSGWLDDNPAGFYALTAYVFSPLALAVADPRWHLKLKTTAAYLGAAVFTAWACVDSINQRMEFTKQAPALCKAMEDQLSSDLYESDNDAYRLLYCSKAYIAHFGVYADLTETTFYVGIVGALALYCLMRGVTVAKEAYYHESAPKEKALNDLRLASEDATDLRAANVESSASMWSLLKLVGGVSVLVFLPVILAHSFPQYEKAMVDAFTAKTIQNQQADGEPINAKTFAETVSIVRDAQWSIVPFLFQEQHKVLPVLAFLGVLMLVGKCYDVLESGNSLVLHREVTTSDIRAAELHILRGRVSKNGILFNGATRAFSDESAEVGSLNRRRSSGGHRDMFWANSSLPSNTVTTTAKRGDTPGLEAVDMTLPPRSPRSAHLPLTGES